MAGKRIVFTNGCYDLLHAGHLSLLHGAARLGDVLVLAINSDASVRRLKGAERPLVPQEDRAAAAHARPVADPWQVRPLVGRGGAARPALRGELVARLRLAHLVEDLAGRGPRARCLLT